MKAFVTGGTGFIGKHVVHKLRERGDHVAALVRSPAQAGDLRELGCEIVEGDLSNVEAIRRGVQGCDSLFHVAATYKVGVRKSEHDAMRDVNVLGTERVLDAAVDAGVGRIVYVSTGNVYGNTNGQVVDESYVRPQPPKFLSYYDRTKYEAHQVALDRIAKGAPIVIVQPGGEGEAMAHVEAIAVTTAQAMLERLTGRGASSEEVEFALVSVKEA